MKLSEMTTDRAAEVLCEITPFVSNIVSDPEATNAFREKLPDNAIVADVWALRAKTACALVPMLLKSHKQDVFGILAALNGVSVEDIAAQKLTDTLKQAKEALKDKELLDFFA